MLGGEVDLHRLDLHAGGAQLIDGAKQFCVLGRHQQVEAVPGELPGQFEPDAARCAGHHGEGLVASSVIPAPLPAVSVTNGGPQPI
jgi:hypothetical protein